MRAPLAAVLVITSLLVVSAPANAFLGPSSTEIPTPRSGDAGVYRIDQLTAEGENVTWGADNTSFVFEVGNRSPFQDAYGEDRLAHVLRAGLTAGEGDTLGVWTEHVDIRGEDLLAMNVSGSAGVSGSQTPLGLIQTDTSVSAALHFYSHRNQSIDGSACFLASPFVGGVLDEGDFQPKTLCGDEALPGDEHGVGVIHAEVVEVEALEEGERSAHVRFAYAGPNATARIDAWYRSDVPYPIEVQAQATRTTDQNGLALPTEPAFETLLEISPFLSWLPSEALEEDENEDGQITAQQTIHLTRFKQGQGEPIPTGPRTDWAHQHQDLDFRPVTSWGPEDGDNSFDYGLSEAVESVQNDPGLAEFQAWLEDHPNHQLLDARHTEDELEGRETQRWSFYVTAPDGTTWHLTSERDTAVEAGDQRIPVEAPVSDNSASEAPPGPGGPIHNVTTPTITSTIQLWRQYTTAGSEGERATAYDWDLAGIEIGRGDTDTFNAEPGQPPVEIDIDHDEVHIEPEDGAVSYLVDLGLSSSWSPNPSLAGSPDEWRTPRTGGGLDDALTSPAVGAVAATSSLLLLLLTAAKLGILPFYSRLKQDQLLDNDARKALYDALDANPGLSLTGVAEATGLARSTARYHLRRLEEGDLLRSVKGPDARRFFVAGAQSDAEMEREAVLQSGRTREVFEAIQQEPGTNLTGVCDATGLAASSAHRIVERLIQAGMIEKRREGRSVVLRPKGPES